MEIKISDFCIGESLPIVLIGGPCVIESYESCFRVARRLKDIAVALETPFIFKSSYDKANRTSVKSFRGPGLERGIEILKAVKDDLDLPVTSDIHCVNDVNVAAGVLDILQIPAFLCRQTDLVVEAARTGKPVNVKKGQFLSPWDMEHIANKIISAGNEQVVFTERGTSFGYNNLISDMRSITVMKGMGHPVVFDATHSVQMPGGRGAQSGGNREFVSPLSMAAVAAGCDGLFMEVHEQPEKALSDSATMVGLDDVEPLLKRALAVRSALRGVPE